MTQYEVSHALKQQGLNWNRGQVAAVEAGNRATVDPGIWGLIAGTFSAGIPELFAGSGMVLLAPGICQSREGYRRTLAGALDHDLPEPDRRQFFDPETNMIRPQYLVASAGIEADVALAQRLGIDMWHVITAARELFNGRTLTEERDRRAAILATERGEPMSSIAAHRGHITRELAAQIEKELDDSQGGG